MSTPSDQPSDERQVSETANLRDDDRDLQQGEGAPPGEDAEQEDQSTIEAEISPEHGGAEESARHARGEETE